MAERIIMANRLVIASSGGERTDLSVSGEWLLVARDAANAAIYVSDSDPFDLAQPPSRAPDGLAARNTLVGKLSLRDAETETYALLLQPPSAGPSFAGTFFPSTGFVRFTAGAATATLVGCGVVSRPGTPLLWSFDATAVPSGS